ncbi:FmdB family transcriptional regulator [Thiohalobacter sp. COW1]|uniref:Regulatory protein n=1 Tax=Thiohalobacter thiocyanaticus TaxID=585455 RepID=A0A1Z4VUA4_9GAMM|nr:MULTISPECIES: zinc ribbon domain-containing protein [Thiohalobacter]BAZ94982.1 regulatory protein [Thiohalobacter thiocyanaticus]BCO33104.1 FmdB family transcriptional regulator [Thiohalobacter sp. COW1]
MPIYEYQCTKCGHELENLQKISDPPLTDCPECGEAALQKLVSAAGFRLKGGGWYETDFKSGSRKNVAESSSNSESSSKPEKKAAGGCGSGGCGCH